MVGVCKPRLPVLVAGLVLVLVGCSGEDPEPKMAPTESVASTPSTLVPTVSPSGSPVPSLPAEADDKTGAGAAAFVRYWVQVVNFAQASGDVSLLETLDDSQCVGCRGVVKAIRRPYSSGGHIEGGAWRVGRLRELPLDFGADWAGFAKSRTDAQTIVTADGARSSYAGGPFSLYAYLAWDDGWRMTWLRTPS